VGAAALKDAGFARRRRRLVETIADHGITDLAILRAFDLVPRHIFLPAAVQHRAYEDTPLPIGFGQTASQPSLQALYMQVLALQPGDRALEVGTGSGFQTAVLSHLVEHVYTVERIAELAARARKTIEGLRINNVAFLVGDGTVGWSRYAPYDAILVAAAGPSRPDALIEQLAPGGRMLVPIGDRREQRLTLFRKTPAGVETEEITAVSFVPLVGRFGWPE
jgi:protein-L-isoaspartate(D-aspartate) O-methyltransferase